MAGFRVQVTLAVRDAASAGLRRVGQSIASVNKILRESFPRTARLTEAAFRRIGKAATRLSKELRSRLVVTFGDIARGARAAFRAVEDAANLRGAEASVRKFVQDAGGNFNEFIALVDAAADSQVGAAQKIVAANRFLAAGASQDEILRFFELARVSATRFGISTSRALDLISTSIQRASPLFLDDLGIVFDLNTVYEEYAAKLGTTASALDDVARRQAFNNKVLEEGRKITAQFADVQDETTASINRARAALEDFRTSVGSLLGGVALLLVSVFQELGASIGRLLGSIDNLRGIIFDLVNGALTKLADVIFGIGQVFSALEPITTAIANRLKSFGGEIALVTGTIQDWVKSLALSADALDEQGDATREAALRLIRYALGIDNVTAGAKRASPAILGAADSTREFAAAAEQANAALGVQAQLIARTTAEFDRLVATQGRAVAVQAAIAGGGVISGNRVFIGGGARFTTDPGLTGRVGNSPGVFANSKTDGKATGLQ